MVLFFVWRFMWIKRHNYFKSMKNFIGYAKNNREGKRREKT